MDKHSRELFNRLKAQGVMPLEVLLVAMRARLEKGELDAAAVIAKDAAPYLHARKASVKHTGPEGGPLPRTKIEVVFVHRNQNQEPNDRAQALRNLPAAPAETKQ
jgi:hypothetical protein